MSLLYRLKQNCPDFVRPVARNIINFWFYRIPSIIFSSRSIYYCPCCNSRLIRFREGEFLNASEVVNTTRYIHIRQDVICPFCYSLPRHRILASYCEQHINQLQNKRILYFALEKGIFKWLKRHNITVTSADLNNPEAELKLDLVDIDQPDNSWDIVFCNHVLEHVKDYKKALNELHRILSPGGTLICSFPIDENLETVVEENISVTDLSKEELIERIRKYGQKDHLRIFGRDSKQLLEKAGFSVTEINGSIMSDDILPIVGPADYDSNIIFVCRKEERS